MAYTITDPPSPVLSYGRHPYRFAGQILQLCAAPSRSEVAVLTNDFELFVIDVDAAHAQPVLSPGGIRGVFGFSKTGALYVQTSTGIAAWESDALREVKRSKPLGGFGVSLGMSSAGPFIVQREHSRVPKLTVFDFEGKRLWEKKLTHSLLGIDEHITAAVVRVDDAQSPNTLAGLAALQRHERTGPSSTTVHSAGLLSFTLDARDGSLLNAHPLSNDEEMLGGNEHPSETTVDFAKGCAFVGWGPLTAMSLKTGKVEWSVKRAESVACSKSHVVAWNDDRLRRVDPETGDALAEVKTPDHFVTAFAAGESFVAIGNDQELCIYGMDDLKRRTVDQVSHSGRLQTVGVTDGATTIVSQGEHQVVAWGKKPRVKELRQHWPGDLNAEGTKLLMPGHPSRVLELATGKVTKIDVDASAGRWLKNGDIVWAHYVEADQGDTVGAAVSVTWSGGKTKSFDAPYLRCIPVIAPDGKLLLVSDEFTLYAYALPSGKHVFTRRKIDPVGVDVSADSKSAAVVTFKDIHLIDLTTGKTRKKLPRPSSDFCQGVRWSPRGDWLALFVGPCCRLVSVDGKHAMKLVDEEVVCVGFSPSGNELAVGGADGQIHLFEVPAHP